MIVETFTLAQIRFTVENKERKIYMNIPPYNAKSKQYEIYNSEKGLVCNYKGEERILNCHLSVVDKMKLESKIVEGEKSLIVELLDWDKFRIKKRRN